MSLDLTGEPFPMDDDKRKRLEAAGWRVGTVAEFLRDLQDPEVYGHAVTQEVRDVARNLASICCRDGHIDIWYDSTDSDKCPLCAVRERE